MKFIIVFAINFILVNSIMCQDVNKYQRALDYIIKDISQSKMRFGNDIFEKNTFVSDSLVMLKRASFAIDILKYEYGNKSDAEKSRLIDSISVYYSDPYDSLTFFKEIKLFNNNNSNAKYKLYFSRLKDNMLSVEIIEKKYELRSYKETMWSVISTLLYYFYFDNNNKIVKVFSEISSK